jgi:hypothetical protein
MALTSNRRNKIIADWKAGSFPSHNAIATFHGVDPKTVKKILEGISQSNAEIVRVGAMYEHAKSSLKNPNEIKAIERAILQMAVKDEIKDEVLDATLMNIKSVKKKIAKQQIETMQDHKNAQDTLDRAMVTSGNAARHAKQIINMQQNTEEVIIVGLEKPEE